MSNTSSITQIYSSAEIIYIVMVILQFLCFGNRHSWYIEVFEPKGVKTVYI